VVLIPEAQRRGIITKKVTLLLNKERKDVLQNLLLFIIPIRIHSLTFVGFVISILNVFSYTIPVPLPRRRGMLLTTNWYHKNQSVLSSCIKQDKASLDSE